MLGSCGHLAGPIDTSERAVTYPGGAWQYFAEWSGLDEAAEAEFEDGDLSYYYYDEVRMCLLPCCPPLLFAVLALTPFLLCCSLSLCRRRAALSTGTAWECRTIGMAAAGDCQG